MHLWPSWVEHWRDLPLEVPDFHEADSVPLRNAIQRHFSASSVRFLGRGFNNSHHLIEGLPFGPAVLRRLLLDVPGIHQRIEREYRVLRHLAEYGYAHAPRPLGCDAEGRAFGQPWLLMTYESGDAVQFDGDTIARLGRIVAQLHRLPLPSHLRRPGAPEDLTAAVLDLLDNMDRRLLASHLSPRQFRGAVVLIGDARKRFLRLWVAPVAPPVLVHGDIGDHNLLSRSAGP